MARLTELSRSGVDPTRITREAANCGRAGLDTPTLLVGLVEDDEPLVEKIHRRVGRMAGAGAGAEAERAVANGASRTVRAAIGFDEFQNDDLERVAALHRRYGRRQMTWMRRMEGVQLLDRTGRSDSGVAAEILELAEQVPSGSHEVRKWQALGNDYVIIEAADLPLGADPGPDPENLRSPFRDRSRRGAADLETAGSGSTSPI